ncbi:unnamed protein product, partial [Staurois parvus]
MVPAPPPQRSAVSWSSPVLPAVSGHLLYCLQSLVISCTVPQSLVISSTVFAASGHPLYCVRSLWSSPVLCPQSLVISCTSLQSLVISCTMSAVHWLRIFFFCFPPL